MLINKKRTDAVLDFIRYERGKQDEKWGEQNHDRGTWLHILMEEIGEASKEQLEGNNDAFQTELLQAGAVIVAWLECELRRNLESEQ